MNQNLSVSVTFHPNKIVVSSTDTTTSGFSYDSNKLTVLPVDVSADLLGGTLRRHFNLCEFDIPPPKDRNKLWIEYKEAAGFKNDNDAHQNAKHVECVLTESDIQLCPSENLSNTGNAGYIYLTDLKMSFPLIISNFDLGRNLFKTKELSKC